MAKVFEMTNVEQKAISIKQEIEKEFKEHNEQELEAAFDEFRKDKRALSFIEYYNKTVLDKERINFGQFKKQWAIQGMKKEVISYFDENSDKLKEEIASEKNIQKFFETHCCKVRKEASFCSKLFHTFLPAEFPPVDNPTKKNFHLQKEDFIKSVLIIKRGYELFVKENANLIKLIRKILSKPKFAYLRAGELSNIRILDMYYWFKLNRLEKLRQQGAKWRTEAQL